MQTATAEYRRATNEVTPPIKVKYLLTWQSPSGNGTLERALDEYQNKVTSEAGSQRYDYQVWIFWFIFRT